MTGLRYFVDPLPGDRGQLVVDLLDEAGRVVQTWPVGSPAPRSSVETAAEEWNCATRGSTG